MSDEAPKTLVRTVLLLVFVRYVLLPVLAVAIVVAALYACTE